MTLVEFIQDHAQTSEKIYKFVDGKLYYNVQYIIPSEGNTLHDDWKPYTTKAALLKDWGY